MTNHDFLADIANNLGGKLGRTPSVAPLRADRWIVRSTLQKAVRRGEAGIAESAALTLLGQDSRSTWRALTVIALEDVGVGAFESLVEVVALARSAAARRKLGAEAQLVAHAARTLAGGWHCQAVCDLLMRAENDPAHAATRADMADASPEQRLELLRSSPEPAIVKAIAILACAAAPTSEGRDQQITAAIEIVAGDGILAQLTRAAWQITRNEMALLLPLIVSERRERGSVDTHAAFDPLTSSPEIADIPAYALDQFTRLGKCALRKLVSADEKLPGLLIETGVPTADWGQLVGDALFLVEGSPLGKRLQWSLGDELRLPFRPLAGAFRLGRFREPVAARITELLPLLHEIRRELIFHHARTLRSPEDAQARQSGHEQAEVHPVDSEHASARPASRWDNFVDSKLPWLPTRSELGFVTEADALWEVTSLRDGSRSGWALAPAPFCGPHLSFGQLNLEAYCLQRLPMERLITVVEMDRARLEALVHRQLKPQLPVAVELKGQLYLYGNAEDAWARYFLGDEQLVVQIVTAPPD